MSIAPTLGQYHSPGALRNVLEFSLKSAPRPTAVVDFGERELDVIDQTCHIGFELICIPQDRYEPTPKLLA
jgi:hypothetical protein